jgi:hypothetical protein
VLTRHGVMLKLEKYDPILVGTIPINIDIESSDLDIVCCWENKSDFIESLVSGFGKESNFTMKETWLHNYKTVIARFVIAHFRVEVFGQAVPTRQQRAYLHMIKEYDILCSKDEAFRKQVIKLKKQGFKTEPAFAELLGLTGDPYEALLTYQP